MDTHTHTHTHAQTRTHTHAHTTHTHAHTRTHTHTNTHTHGTHAQQRATCLVAVITREQRTCEQKGMGCEQRTQVKKHKHTTQQRRNHRTI